ncbi:MAG: hypothetical protein EOO38_20605 [Cytophagaceae bacterium]|nr:MAG: hypothetical protein EOO38_20605 [Cytophagaceae bacterium]
MKKLILISLPVLALTLIGCSGNNTEEAPAPKGNVPNVSPPPPGMTGPGQRAGGPGGAPVDSGEGSR